MANVLIFPMKSHDSRRSDKFVSNFLQNFLTADHPSWTLVIRRDSLSLGGSSSMRVRKSSAGSDFRVNT